MEPGTTPPSPARHHPRRPLGGRRVGPLVLAALVVVTAVSVLASGCGSDGEVVVVAGATAGAQDTITVTGKGTASLYNVMAADALAVAWRLTGEMRRLSDSLPQVLNRARLGVQRTRRRL